MLICIPNVLSKDDVAEFRRLMDASEWEDGRSTAGAQSALVKRNEQLPPDSEVARKLGKRVISALTANPRFISAAVPLQIFPPLFNRYAASDGTISASMSTTPYEAITYRACAFARTCRSRYFYPSRRSTTAANSWSKTSTDPMKSSYRRGISYFILLLVCIWSPR